MSFSLLSYTKSMKNILILSLLVLFSSCSIFKPVASEPTEIIAIRKTPCRGECKVYSLSIYDNGLVKYEGKKHVAQLGEFEKTISKAELKELKKAFDLADFMALADEYTSKVTDLPSTYVSYTVDGKTKIVRDHYRAPQALIDLELLIESVIKEWVD